MTSKERERRIQREMRRCVHFTGIPLFGANPGRCRAGVDYGHVRVDCDKVGPGVPFGFPCVDSDIRTCPRRELLTREQAEVGVDEGERKAQAFLAKIAMGVCAVCGDESTDFKQVGKRIYSVPCGHRVGQGSAAKYRAGVKRARRERSS
jgi:hypothetical protein